MENKQYIKFYRYVRLIGTTASVLLFLFAALAVFPFAPKTSNLAEAITVPVESETEIAMVVERASANLTITPTNPTGNFASSSDNDRASFNVTTNNYTGYTLSISAQDDDGELTSGATDNAFNSIESVIVTDVFDNPIYNGRWGYVPSKYDSLENTFFRPSPTTDASILDVTNTANTESNNYTIGLGARADLTTGAGTYTDTFILTAVGNPVLYTINYTDNSGDSSVSNMPNNDSGSSVKTQVPISTVIPTRDNYLFEGWCDAPTVLETDGTTTCPGTTYKATTDEGITFINFINQTVHGNSITLYSIWAKDDSTYDITIKMSGRVYAVQFGDFECTESSGECVVRGVKKGETYTINASVRMVQGIRFVWNPGENGTIAEINQRPTTYTVGEGSSTITATTVSAPQTVTVNLSEGIANVNIESDNGYSVKVYNSGTEITVESDRDYTITASVKKNYKFSSWDASVGSGVADGQANPTTFSTTMVASLTANAEPTCIISISGYMQDIQDTTGYCDGAVGTVIDKRDNEEYAVAKMSDGNIWMLDNLRLGANYSIRLTSADSNVGNDYDLPAATNDTFNSYVKPQINIAYKDTVVTHYGQGTGKAGVYYNTCATHPNYCLKSEDIYWLNHEDICPKWWHIPMYYENLYDYYNNNVGFYEALSISLAGFISNNTSVPRNVDVEGNFLRYRISTKTQRFQLSANNEYSLNFEKSVDRRNGTSVRCVTNPDAMYP